MSVILAWILDALTDVLWYSQCVQGKLGSSVVERVSLSNLRINQLSVG
jgi:hypothetical protein